MTGLTAYLKGRATGRAVAASVILAALLYLLRDAVLVPYFRDVTGFVPFDVQFPLTRFMMAIQLGAYHSPAAARVAYLPFLVIDVLYAFASAASLMFLWTWLFMRQPNQIFDFLERGAVVLVPAYTLICDVGENIAFAWLVGDRSGEGHPIGFWLAEVIHGVRGALLDLQMILTGVFVIIFVFTATREGLGRAEREEKTGHDE